MLSNDDHPGLFTFMVGMIVLVFAGVGLSIMVDKRLKSSTAVIGIQDEIGENIQKLDELKSVYDSRVRMLADSEASLRTGSQAHGELAPQMESMRKRQADLEKTRDQLRVTVQSLEEGFSSYRTEFRRKTWARAIGEKLGNLTIHGEREYRDVTITRVTEVGLEIRHENGLARIQAPDLSQELQNRFQWSENERQHHLINEQEMQRRQSGEPPVENVAADSSRVVPSPKTRNLDKTRSPVDEEKLKLLRRQVSAWQLKITQLESEKREASSHAAYDKQHPSVQGSLETWEAKQARMVHELTIARTALANVRLELAQISPGDAVLRSSGNDG